jgi:hypothetical protein
LSCESAIVGIDDFELLADAVPTTATAISTKPNSKPSLRYLI